jgi:DNA phosphorothioation-dependent restriction protein DptG
MSPVSLKDLNDYCDRPIRTRDSVGNKKSQQDKRYVYFVKSESGHIKIGSSNNVKRRMAIMRTDCPFKIKLLGKMAIGEFTECQIHKIFKRFRYRGEWFIETIEIIEFINSRKMGKRKKSPNLHPPIAPSDFTP